jgi:glucan-binding YG repeat protein
MKTKFTSRKIISYLLMFFMILGVVEPANIHIAKAATLPAERTFAEQIVLKSYLDTNQTNQIDTSVVVDLVSNKLTYEKINLATKSFTIEGTEGYVVTSVTNTAKSMSSSTGTSSFNGSFKLPDGSSPKKYVYTINEYSNFSFTITVQSTKDGTVNTYNIDMKYDLDSVFQFDSISITYIDVDGKKTQTGINYNEKDTDGYYRSKDVATNIVKAQINLISGSYIITEGVKVNGGTPGADIALSGGDNYIPITITHNNSTMQFDLIISKKGEALLKSLVPSTGSLSPTFTTDVMDYTISVPTTQTTIAFTPTSVDNASTIKVGKYVVKSGKKSSDISLSEGNNKILIVVTTREGETSTYSVNVVRSEKFRSANLSALQLSSGTLNPAFNKEIYSYSASVDNSVSSITVTATAEDPASTIKINDVKIPSGAASGSISLNEGGNLINISVTDTNGKTNTYTIAVSRKYSKDNVNLASLSVTDGTFSPRFDPETYAYSVRVARNIEKVKIMYKSQNEKAKVKINGKEYTNGQSDYIKLELGANNADVQVIAEDGKTTTTYKLSIIRGDIEGTNRWILIAGEWNFYNAEGIQIKNQWVKYDNQYYFVDINGSRKTGWLLESGNWYYLNNEGIMITGWFYDKGYWYYFQGNGAMRVGVWATYDGKWYCFNNFGEMATGWTQYKGKWFYLDDHGVMQKGWITYDKNKYYLNDDGSMRYGWLYTGKTWYYLDGEGKMVRGWQVIDGKRYYFDANGLMKTGMMFLDGQWINLNNV